MKLQRIKLQQETKDTRKTEYDKLNTKVLATNANLSKLIITKFKGTHLECARFWNQFKAKIDTVNIPQVTKFSYLKEMLHPQFNQVLTVFYFQSRVTNEPKMKYG